MMKKLISFFVALQLLLHFAFFALADELIQEPEPGDVQGQLPQVVSIEEQNEDEFSESEDDLEPQDEVQEMEEQNEEGINLEEQGVQGFEEEDELEVDSENEEPVFGPTIFINEILADPSSDEAENEFIELYNFGESTFDLSGWQLDDGNLEDDKIYLFDNEDLNYFLAPGEFITFFRPETNLTLNNDADAVYLFDDQGEEIDSYVFESTFVDRSWGRNPENREEWMIFSTPTPDAENIFSNQAPVPVITVQGGTGGLKLNVTAAESHDPDGDAFNFLWTFEAGVFDEKENPSTYTFAEPGQKTITLRVTDEFGAFAESNLPFLAASEDLKEEGEESEEVLEKASESIDYPHYSLINEFLPDPQGSDAEGEWVELYNATGAKIDLSGWYLDDEDGASSPFQIPEQTVLEAGAFLLFKNPELDLSLKNSEDVLRLLDPNRLESQRVTYSDSQEGWSYALTADQLFAWTPLFTPEAENAFPPPPKTYEPGAVLFESVFPDPEGADKGKEKILLKNTLGESVDLSYWTIRDKTGEQVLMDLEILPHSNLELLSEDFVLNLNNSDESLSLFDPAEHLIDGISWDRSVSGQWLFNTNSLSEGMQVLVEKVVDGDTIKISFDDKHLTLRLLGVDTPETVHPSKPIEAFGKEASDYLKSLLDGKSVILHFDEHKLDAYGRVLAYVYLDDVFVNAEILRQGYGYAYTRFPFQFLEDFKAYEAEAKAAGLGLWADPELASLIEEEAGKKAEAEEDPSTSTLLTLTEDVSETEEKEGEEDDETLSEAAQKKEDDEGVQDLLLECDSAGLKLDSILPYAEKDVSEEFIKIINTGSDELCLVGWQLDDEQQGGSKPFTIREGTLAPGEARVFGKEETKISLNNSNDCATLIRPTGEVADEICYGKTKKNEIFTHQGGSAGSTSDSESKKESSRASASESSVEETAKHAFQRDSSSYRSELVNDVFEGYIIGIDEEEEVLIIRLPDESIRPVSYAHSLFDMEMAKTLIEMSELVTFEAYQTSDFAYLISMQSPRLLHGAAPERNAFFYILMVLPLAALGALAYKKWKSSGFKWFSFRLR